MSSPSSLITVLNTRPERQAQALNQFLEKMGIQCISLPTLRILSFQPEQTHSLCQQLNSFDIIIFTSAHAVYFSQPYWPHSLAKAKIIAMGPGTAKALAQYNIGSITPAESYCSEAIIELPLLRNITKKSLLILCGRHPRPLLRKTLTERNAQVTLCECYQRAPPLALDKHCIMKVTKQPINAIVSTSKESLKNLNTLLPAIQLTKHTPLIVISQGMKRLAVQQGWKEIFVAENATSEAIAGVIQHL